MKRRLALLAVSALLFLPGCASLGDAKQARGEGLARTFDAPFDSVWKAVPQALTSLGLQLAADNRQEGYVLAERGVSAFSWGEKVAVFVDRTGDKRTKVEVVSKRAVSANVFATEWGTEVLQRIDQILNRPQ